MTKIQIQDEERPVRIILQTMVKNESKIIRRLLASVINFVDAVLIADTGSTDNTVELADEYLKSTNKPYHITHHSWKNFGHNRTLSFTACQDFCKTIGWDPATTYGLLLDGDMILKPQPAFDRNRLTEEGYSIIQKSSSLEYNNSRFLRLDHPWKCVGATHEYWDGKYPKFIPKKYIYIDDIGDGGAKADKFERDIRLLLEDLKEDPSNARTHFYLAQSYMCIKKLEEAIEYYKKRIELGGWFEEVWYSHYMIGKLYLELDQPQLAEMWIQKGQAFSSYRSEGLYQLVKYFREKGKNYKAYHYYLEGKDIKKPENGLFIESDVYDYLFDYERTIIEYYTHKHERNLTLEHIIQYLNKKGRPYFENVFSNLMFYVPTLTSKGYKAIPYSFPNINEYRCTSSSLLFYKNRRLLNVRYVNYSIRPDGSYDIRHPHNIVKTINRLVYLDDNYMPIQPLNLIEWKEELPNCTKHDTNIQGLEDVRLFQYNNNVWFTATQKEYSEGDKIRIALAKLNMETLTVENDVVLQPPTPTDCEKNWIPLVRKTSAPQQKDKLQFIYGWHPLTIGELDSPQTNKLSLKIQHETPEIWSRIRGSSPPVSYHGKLWLLTHLVHYSTPRKYYHCIVTLDPVTYKPLQYSSPFAFCDIAIEYALTFSIVDGEIIMIFSRNDADTTLMRVPLGDISMKDI